MNKFFTKTYSPRLLYLANFAAKSHNTLFTNTKEFYLEVPRVILSKREAHTTKHPEKLKQIIKEEKSKTLCNYYGSEEYKNKLNEMNILLIDGSNKASSEKEEKPKKGNTKDALEPPPVKKIVKKIPVKTTIMSVIMRKKSGATENPIWYSLINKQNIIPKVLSALPDILKQKLNQEKVYRKRTTILPIFLQKTREKLLREGKDVKYRYYLASNQLSARSIMTQKDEAENAAGSKPKGAVKGAKYSKANLAAHSEVALNKKKALHKESRKRVHAGKVVCRKMQIRKRKSIKREMLAKGSEINLPADSQVHCEGSLPDTVKKISEDKETNATKFKLENRTPKRRPQELKNLTINNILTLFEQVKLDTQTKPLHLSSHDLTKYSKKKTQMSECLPDCFERPSYTYRTVKKAPIKASSNNPEGYRIMLYSVRDPDPTKLNFSDAVKAFCMFNDVVLSLDGLQEGYIVIFDMRGVQIGHLARVNLPALRCFMHYIQEAHPCRLKQIHVLNTATWIHHVMRLVIPLVKSEILNLVKFHKGNVPENFPLELLPQNYGGEQKTVEELNEQTKNVMLEYVHWLIESGEFISDETKRVKKSSWWGFLAGTNKSAETAELDEKTILKNLQID